MINVQLDRCVLHKDIWQKMIKPGDIESQLSVCPTIQSALEIIHDIKDNNLVHVNALFTGSLHLIGSTLGLLNNSEELRVKLIAKAKTLRS